MDDQAEASRAAFLSLLAAQDEFALIGADEAGLKILGEAIDALSRDYRLRFEGARGGD